MNFELKPLPHVSCEASATSPDSGAGSGWRRSNTTAELLAQGYRRWFEPLHGYVSQYVADSEVRERIVREVLVANLDLLVGRREEASERLRLETTADRLIAEAVTEAERFLEGRRRGRLSRPGSR